MKLNLVNRSFDTDNPSKKLFFVYWDIVKGLSKTLKKYNLTFFLLNPVTLHRHYCYKTKSGLKLVTITPPPFLLEGNWFWVMMIWDSCDCWGGGARVKMSRFDFFDPQMHVPVIWTLQIWKFFPFIVRYRGWENSKNILERKANP